MSEWQRLHPSSQDLKRAKDNVERIFKTYMEPSPDAVKKKAFAMSKEGTNGDADEDAIEVCCLWYTSSLSTSE